MDDLKTELEHNYLAFRDRLKLKILENYDKLSAHKEKFQENYIRLSSLEAWKAFIVEQYLPGESLEFFIETQNDVLLSHFLANIGSWRPALQSLRSSLDNILFFSYYKDHSIEYLLWVKGKHKIPISDYIAYLDKHPIFQSISVNLSALPLLKTEYSKLSSAVHSSSVSFRMTSAPETYPALMVPEEAKLNQWCSRERNVLKIINLILLPLFKDFLSGTQLPDLRKAISFCISANMNNDIQNELGIRLFAL